MRRPLLLFPVLLLAACGREWAPPPPLAPGVVAALGPFSLRNHLIYVDSDGRVLDPVTGEAVDPAGQGDYAVGILTRLRAFQDLSPATPVTVVLSIHGGLNDFDDVVEAADRHARQLLARGQYPLFIGWNSSLGPNYLDHLFVLRSGRRYPRTGWMLSPFVLAGDLVGALMRLPGSLVDSGVNVLVAAGLKAYVGQEESRAVAARGERNGFHLHDGEAGPGESWTSWLTVWNPLKLVTAPIVDAGGKGAWRSMCHRAALVLDAQEAFEEGVIRSTVVRDLLTTWEAACRPGSDDPLARVELHLFGHSMGTMIANEILVRHPRLPYRAIVYLAAACSLADVERCVVPVLRNDLLVAAAHGRAEPPATGVRFYDVCLHPHRDRNENATGWDLVPRGSLLVWIDSFLGEVDSYKDRTAGFWFNVIRAAPSLFPADVASRVHLTRFGVGGDTPQCHGDFYSYAFWLEDFWTDTAVWSLLADRPNALPAATVPAAARR